LALIRALNMFNTPHFMLVSRYSLLLSAAVCLARNLIRLLTVWRQGQFRIHNWIGRLNWSNFWKPDNCTV